MWEFCVMMNNYIYLITYAQKWDHYYLSRKNNLFYVACKSRKNKKHGLGLTILLHIFACMIFFVVGRIIGPSSLLITLQMFQENHENKLFIVKTIVFLNLLRNTLSKLPIPKYFNVVLPFKREYDEENTKSTDWFKMITCKPQRRYP